MKKPLPKPLFIALLLIVVSILSVSTILATTFQSESKKKAAIDNTKSTPKTTKIVTNEPAVQPAITETPPPELEPQTPTPQPKKVEPPQTQSQTKPTVKAATDSVTKVCSGNLSTKFLCLLNEYRASKKLSALSYNNALANVATSHSTWMSTSQTLAHINADGVRHNVRCEQAGTICRAENLAQGIMEAEELLSEWKKSGSHNVNLLGPYSTIGLGVSGDYITLLFN